MHRLLPALIAALVVAAPGSASAEVRKGPGGPAFYTPPSTLPKGPHGTPIWQRKLTSGAVIKGARSNTLLLYKSAAVDGSPIAVSGTVALPKGKPPKGGWPVVSWAHGTVGIADQCAPSRFGTGYDQPLLRRFLKEGYAVVRTDYEGLGTPGPHPYLVGVSEGRSVLDIVRAARKLDKRVGKRLVIAGHSQGGQAALFAGSLARRWTPELKLRGTLAFAPVSHLGEQGRLLSALSSPGPLSALAAMIVRGVDIANPALGIPDLLSDRAKALYPQVDERCIGGLATPDSFGAVAPAELFRPGAALDPVIAALDANDAETLTIRGPVRIEQGLDDTVVFPNFTNALVDEYKRRGMKVTYKTYPGVDHRGVVTLKPFDWVRKRL